MQSKIFIGETYHCRLKPRKHQFSYPMLFVGIKLDELAELSNKVLLFSYNKWNLFSVCDIDFFSKNRRPIVDKLSKHLGEKALGKNVDEVHVITTPRYLGYVFNPVSFYCCYEKGTLSAFVAEVNNTFDEKHTYVFSVEEASISNGFYRFEFDKLFYVSPFFDVSGRYEILLKKEGDGFDIRVNLMRAGEMVFTSRLVGEGQSFNSRNLSLAMLRFPLSILLTMFRIEWQAFKLFFGKKITLVLKPDLLHSKSIVRAPKSVFARFRERAIVGVTKFWNHRESKFKSTAEEL